MEISSALLFLSVFVILEPSHIGYVQKKNKTTCMRKL